MKKIFCKIFINKSDKKTMPNLVWGFSLIETIIYLAIFTVMSVLVINSFITILSSFNKTNIDRRMLESGSAVMEKMSREIRQAKNVDIANSTLGSTPGVLQLNSTDDDGNPVIIKFIVENQSFNLYRNGVLVGNLLNKNISITNLIFRRVSTTNSEAVKIEMILQYSDGRDVRTENFYNTIVLRGGY